MKKKQSKKYGEKKKMEIEKSWGEKIKETIKKIPLKINRQDQVLIGLNSLIKKWYKEGFIKDDFN